MSFFRLTKRRIRDITNVQTRAGLRKAFGDYPSNTAGPRSDQNAKL
jgi:hypothetical protein